jgi:hypothetical protein
MPLYPIPAVDGRRFVPLGDLQIIYRGLTNARERDALRQYLLEGCASSPAIFVLVSGSLYVTGQVDKAGLSDEWLAGASVKERARLFREVATARLNGGTS